MGIFWKRANKWGATAGMAVGLAVTFTYMAHSHPWLRELVFGIPPTQPLALWWGIQPLAAGIFGAPAAFLTILVVSWLTPRPDPATEALVDYIRDPRPVAAVDVNSVSGQGIPRMIVAVPARRRTLIRDSMPDRRGEHVR